MAMLDILDHDHGIRELRLNRPPVNALDPALIASLRHAIEHAPREGAQALVISGSPGMFSAGLDVPALLQLDRNAMCAFWVDFLGVCATLARSPVPSAAAITGHSPAGGAVIALFCDYRVLTRGAFRIGLNEVRVGLAVPDQVGHALRRLVGARRAERMLVEGAMVEPDQALASGLVDELADIDFVVQRARDWLAGLLQLPRHAMLATRRRARADLIGLFEDPSALTAESLLDTWFAPEAQATLRAMVENLKARQR